MSRAGVVVPTQTLRMELYEFFPLWSMVIDQRLL